MNKLITNEEIKSVIKNLKTSKQVQDQTVLTMSSTKYLKN